MLICNYQHVLLVDIARWWCDILFCKLRPRSWKRATNLSCMRAGQATLMDIPDVPERGPLFIHGWSHAAIGQSTPSAGEINTLTVSLRSFGVLPASSTITMHGLRDTLTYAPLLVLSHNETVYPSPIGPMGVWNHSAGSLSVNLTSQLPSQQTFSFSFTVRNPYLGQDGAEVSIEVAGLISKVKMLSAQKNEAALLVADFLQRDIAQVCINVLPGDVLQLWYLSTHMHQYMRFASRTRAHIHERSTHRYTR